MIYNISDKPKKISEWVLYSLQQLLSVFVATVLIAEICGTPVDACLIGACIGTLTYQVITKFKSPMFISSCGATCSAVIGALSMSSGNYLAVMIGGFVIFAVYTIFAILVKVRGVDFINKLFPPTVVGPVTMVIGLNLATFISTYCGIEVVDGVVLSNIRVIVALLTMLAVAVSSHYFRGFLKTIPFLIGLAFGYIVSVIFTLTGVEQLIDFTVFSGVKLFSIPDFAFMHITGLLDFDDVLNVVVLFLPVAICAMLEHFSDHKVLSNIIGTDLTKEPGLHRTLLGDGLASFIGTVTCGLPNTSYGESIATTGFSKVCSVAVLTVTALILGAMSFFGPIIAVIKSIPQCVFGGCAIILYGYIAASGLKTIINNKVDLDNNKNLIIVCAILTTGVSGILLFSESFAGTSLAMVIGVVLNLILVDKKGKQ